MGAAVPTGADRRRREAALRASEATSVSGYQFIHIEAYGTAVSAAKARAKANGKQQASRPLTVRQVIEEAQRRPGSCPHVPEPLRPIEHLATIPLGRLAEEVERRKAASRDLLGRAVRKDALCMIGGVVSFPTPVSQMDEDHWAVFGQFLDRVEGFLRKRFGGALVNMTVHEDETYPHIHFYVLPEAGEGTFTLIGLHPGITARERAGKAKKGGAPELTKQRNAAYVQAMRDFQDNFYREVGQLFDMQRYGPKRSRMTRGEWNTVRHQFNIEGVGAIVEENDALKAELAAMKRRVADLERRTSVEDGGASR